MKISTQPPLHLSNHEVLTHFLALKGDTDNLKKHRDNHDLRQKVELRKKYPLEKEREDSPDATGLPSLTESVRRREEEADRRGWSDELAWIQDEVITYLCSDHVPTARQTAEGVTQLADELQDHHLTKAEILQIVNLTPTTAVELYTIIEEVEARFPETSTELLEQITQQVADTLLPQPPAELEQYVTRTEHDHPAGADQQAEAFEDDEEGVMQQEFVTEAEYGAGYEGGVDDDAKEDMD